MKNQLPEDYIIQLKYDSPKEWIDAVLADFDSFLINHADNERKASTMALSFVAKAPDKTEIIAELIDIGLEELVHFKQVYRLMSKRELQFPSDIEKDLYINKLIKFCRSGWKERFLDRLIMVAVVESRGAERFKLVAENHPEREIRDFYTMLYKSEYRHGTVFVEMALVYYDKDEVMSRLDEFLTAEAKICEDQGFTGLIH